MRVLGPVDWVDGIRAWFYCEHGHRGAGLYETGGHNSTGWWNPLTDDGDALRLAVKLNILVFSARGFATANAAEHDGECVRLFWGTNEEAAAATRRAIVRAASSMAGEGGNP